MKFQRGKPLRLNFNDNDEFDYSYLCQIFSRAGFPLPAYQIRALKFLMRFSLGEFSNSIETHSKTLIAMACGLGKTLIAILFIKIMMLQNRNSKSYVQQCLFVVPVNLINQVVAEFAKWDTEINLETNHIVTNFSGTPDLDQKRKWKEFRHISGSVMITSTASLQKIYTHKKFESIKTIVDDLYREKSILTVLDECHHIDKTAKQLLNRIIHQKTTKKFKLKSNNVTHVTQFVVGLSATPYASTALSFNNMLELILSPSCPIMNKTDVKFIDRVTQIYAQKDECSQTDLERINEIFDKTNLKLASNTFWCSSKPIVDSRDMRIIERTIVVNLAPDDQAIIDAIELDIAAMHADYGGRPNKKDLQNAMLKFLFAPRLVYQKSEDFFKTHAMDAENDENAEDDEDDDDDEDDEDDGDDEDDEDDEDEEDDDFKNPLLLISSQENHSQPRTEIISESLFNFPTAMKLVIIGKLRNNISLWNIVKVIIGTTAIVGRKTLMLSSCAMGLQAWFDCLPLRFRKYCWLAIGGGNQKNAELLSDFKEKVKSGLLMATNGTGGEGFSVPSLGYVVEVGLSTMQTHTDQGIGRGTRFTRVKGDPLYVLRILVKGIGITATRYRAFREYGLARLMGNKNAEFGKRAIDIKEHINKKDIIPEKDLESNSLLRYIYNHAKYCKYELIATTFEDEYTAPQSSHKDFKLGYDCKTAVERINLQKAQLGEFFE